MKGKTSAKADLRRTMRHLLRDLPQTKRLAESQKIRSQLNFPPDSRVALFAGTLTEVQLLDLLSSSEKIQYFLPRVTDSTTMEFLPVSASSALKKGSYGILEPSEGIPAAELDFIICPGLAFTIQGHRLGQGGGFYDRALQDFPSAKRIGVAYHCQILDALPIEEHDLKMDQVVTSLLESLNEKLG